MTPKAMTPKEIYSIINNNISNNRLALSGSALGAGDIEGLFNKYLPDGVLIINNSVLSQPAGDVVRLTGTGGCHPFSGMAVTADFSTKSESGVAAIQLEAIIGEGWHFHNSFAKLAGTVLESLDITGTRKLSLSSFDAPGFIKGLYFQGDLMPGQMGAVSQIFPGCASITIAGGIDIQHGIPQMALISNLNLPVSIGFLQGLTFQIGIVSTPIVPKDDESKAYAYVQIELSSDIAFKSLGQHLPIKASFYTDSPLVSFRLDLNNIMDISFGALQSLLDNASVVSLVPSGFTFTIGDVVKLNDLSILVNLQEKKLATIAIIVQTTKTLSLIDGVIEIPELSLLFSLAYSSGKKELSLGLFGSFSIGTNGIILVEASYPNFEFSGRLKEGTKIKLEEIIDKFLPGEDIDIDATITELDFSADLKSKEYSFGFALDTDWPIVVGGKEIISINRVGMEISHSNVETSGKVYGTVVLNDDQNQIAIDISASYDGADEGWVFEGKQTEGKIKLASLINKYLLPDWSPESDSESKYDIDGLGITVKPKTKSFSLTGKTADPWKIPFPVGDDLQVKAGMLLSYDGSNKAVSEKDQSRYSGNLSAEINYYSIDMKLSYEFAPDNKGFHLSMAGITGKIEEVSIAGAGDTKSKQWVGSLSFGDQTLGEMVETFITWGTGDTFGLASPWDLLNQISLSSLKLNFNFTTKKISFDYPIGPITLPFGSIDSIGISYNPTASDNENKVNVEIKGKFTVVRDDGTVENYNHDRPLTWDATKPEKTPVSPGMGSKYFDLRLMALGQHVGVTGLKNITKVQEAMDALEGLPADPDELMTKLNTGSPIAFDPESSWLVAADFGILRLDSKQTDTGSSPQYLISLDLIFNDPNLYGLRIALAKGEAAKIFAGLSFEIMYRKISDTLGVFQSEITLPDTIRHFEMGAFTITLPVLAIEVYTNGDFMVDLGFPWKMDFSRSFSIQGFAGPIPVLGAGGIYFGKLSSATSNQVPKSDYGSFNPVIVFGLGLQLGVGKTIEKGPLKAGLSIEIIGILEGVIAKWNPNQTPVTPQDSYYYWLQGILGIAAKLFGQVDLSIIKASVSVSLAIYAKIIYECYADIPISVGVSVEISLSLEIDCGLFKIKISLSFSMRIEESFVIKNPQSSQIPPWRRGPGISARSSGAHLGLRGLSSPSMSRSITHHWDNYQNSNRSDLMGYFVPVLSASEKHACYVTMLFLGADSPKTSDKDTSFETLCKEVLRWTVASAMPERKYDRDYMDACSVSDDLLVEILKNLRDKNQDPIEESRGYSFIKRQFKLNLTLPATHGTVAVFPMPPDLSLKRPRDDRSEDQTYKFSEANDGKNKLTKDGISSLRDYFDRLAVQVEKEMESESEGIRLASGGLDKVSVASFIFEDYILLLARQMVEYAKEGLRSFPYRIQTVSTSETVGEVLRWINDNAYRLEGADLTGIYRYSSGTGGSESEEERASRRYRIQVGDTLSSIAQKRYSGKFDLDILVLANADLPGILNSDIVITCSSQNYTVTDSDTLRSVANELNVPIRDLITEIGSSEDLLKPLGLLIIPITAEDLFEANSKHQLNPGKDLTVSGRSYQVLRGDSLESIVGKYPGQFDTIRLAQVNADVAGIINPGVEITSGQKPPYKVNVSDTLNSVAKGLGVSLEDLVKQVSKKDLLADSRLIIVPDITYTTQKEDTPESVANRYGVSVKSLANNSENLTDLFSTNTGDVEAQSLKIPYLKQLKLGLLLEEIQRTKCLEHLSGMASRYMLHGTRLPTAFFQDWNMEEKLDKPSAGLYELTGQQFILPELTTDKIYSFSLLKESSDGWVTFNGNADDTWLEFKVEDDADGKKDKSRALAIQKAARDGFNIETKSIGPGPTYRSQPITYPFRSVLTWHSPEGINLPKGGTADPKSLMIWSLPESLTELAASNNYAPRMSIWMGTYNPSSSVMEEAEVSSCAWGTLLEITIKKIPEDPSCPSTKNTYELIGTGEQGIVLLERLLSNLTDDKNLINDITLLYRPVQTGGAEEGLQSNSKSNSITFIIQANLTTETRPPEKGLTLNLAEVAETASTTGYLNTPYEFVRLLWENSITRSGGYYLYYLDKNSSSGFPDWIFNDRNEAKIYLLLTYSQPGHVAGYVNCAVTADAIDPSRSVVFARVPKDPIQYKTVEGDTLASIAERNFMTSTELAEDNPEVCITEKVVNKVVVVNGIYFRGSCLSNRIKSSGKDPSNLQHVADYLGTTLNLIKAANPRRSRDGILSEGEAICLPRFEVPLGSSLSLKLSDLASDFGCSIPDLARENRDLSLAPEFNLKVRGGPNLRVPSTALGSMPIGARRLKPDNVPDDPGSFSHPYLMHIFNMLGYAIKENDFFADTYNGEGSSGTIGLLSLPIGPVQSSESDDAGKIRDPSEPGGLWEYHYAVPYSRLAKGVQASKTTDDLAIQDPCAGVGGLLQVTFDWRDVFGNVIHSDTSSAQSTTVTMLTGYTDQLIGLSQWPGISCYYFVDSPTPGTQARLKVVLHFNPNHYSQDSDETDDSRRSRAGSDLAKYTRLYYQLLGSKFSLETSLLTAPIKLEGTQREDLLNWIFQEIMQYLSNCSKSSGEVSAFLGNPDLEISEPLDENLLNPGKIFELIVAFRIQRSLIHPEFGEVESVYNISTEIPPWSRSSTQDQPHSLSEFAQKLEAALITKTYKFKVATGVNRLNNGRKSIWLARLGIDNAISYQLLNQGVPNIFAPRPIYTSPKNGTYKEFPFTDVDMDTWLKEFLSAVDKFFTPQFLSPMVIVWDWLKRLPIDKMNSKFGNDFNTKDSFVDRLQNSKTKIASYLSNLLIQAIEPLPGDVLPQGEMPYEITDKALNAAREEFRQRMLAQLSSFYSIEAAVQFYVKANLLEDTGCSTGSSFRLYGSPRAISDHKIDIDEGASLTSAKIALEEEVDFGESNSLLTFLLQKDKENDGIKRVLTLGLGFEVTSIEHQIGALSGIEGYEASSWLTFINPEEDLLKGNLGYFQLPQVLRALPTPPSMVSQEGISSATSDGNRQVDPSGIDLALDWDYIIEYSKGLHEQQDKIEFRVQFNQMMPKLLGFNIDLLFNNLAEFINIYPALEKDLEVLRGIDARALDDNNLTTLVLKVNSFINLINGVADALNGIGINDADQRGLSSADLVTTRKFSLMEKSVIKKQNGEDVDSLVVEITLLDSWDGAHEPVVKDIGDYKAFLDSSNPPNYSYCFKDGAGNYLSGQNGRKMPSRKVAVPNLNILQLQDAQAWTQVKRNEFTVTLKADSQSDKRVMRVKDSFVYSTQEIGFPNPYRPMIESYADVDMSKVGSTTGTPICSNLDAHIGRLMNKIFERIDQSKFNLQAEVEYCFKVNESMPSVRLPILMMPLRNLHFEQGNDSITALSRDLSGAIIDWARSNRPGNQNDASDLGSIQFDLTLSTGMTQEAMPLLRLHNLRLDTKCIKDWPVSSS